MLNRCRCPAANAAWVPAPAAALRCACIMHWSQRNHYKIHQDRNTTLVVPRPRVGLDLVLWRSAFFWCQTQPGCRWRISVWASISSTGRCCALRRVGLRGGRRSPQTSSEAASPTLCFNGDLNGFNVADAACVYTGPGADRSVSVRTGARTASVSSRAWSAMPMMAKAYLTLAFIV